MASTSRNPFDQVRNLLGNIGGSLVKSLPPVAAYNLGKQSLANLQSPQTAQNLNTGMNLVTNVFAKSPFRQIGYDIPKQAGESAANAIYSGAKQIQSGQPSQIPFTNVKVPSFIAGPVKIGYGALGLTPGAVVPTYASALTQSSAEKVPGLKGTPIPSLLGLAAGFVGPTGGRGIVKMSVAKRQEILDFANHYKIFSDMVKRFDTLTPQEQMQAISMAKGLGNKIIPDVAKSREMIKMSSYAPQKWLGLMDTYLGDKMYRAQHPEINVGYSVSALKREPTQPTGGGGEIWKQNLSDFVNSFKGKKIEGQGYWNREGVLRSQWHDAVDTAIQTGKPVPQSVLDTVKKEYPDIVSRYPDKFTPTPTGGVPSTGIPKLNAKIARIRQDLAPIVQEYSDPQSFIYDRAVTRDVYRNMGGSEGLTKFFNDTKAGGVPEVKATQTTLGQPETATQIPPQSPMGILGRETAQQPSQIVPPPESLAPTGGGSQGGSSKDIIAPGTKYAFNINLDRLNISPEAKSQVEGAVASLKPELQTVKGGAMSQGEIIQAAIGADSLRKTITREETLRMNAAILKTRQAISAGAEGKGLSRDFLQAIKLQAGIAQDWGRRGQTLQIGADPLLTTSKEAVVAHLVKLGNDLEKIYEAGKNVDFNNPKEVTAFYRQFVKPSWGEVIGEYRYINLLSSPKTHIVNAFSNVIQGLGISPATKLVSGAVDAFGSKILGKQQEHYLSEVPSYYRGMFNSTGDAVSKFFDALKGTSFVERPDVSRIPTGNRLLAPLQVIPRALEASDVFFRTLIKGGEMESLATKYQKMGKAVAPAVMDQQATDKAAYYIFRKALDPNNATGQGKVLSYIDKFTTAVYGFRKVPGVGWFIPFVQTPMNIVKQGIEYSPLGVTTLAGSADKTEAISKALIGSGVMVGAAFAIQKGDSTWAAPTSKGDKEAFYASGRQPYSIKIGNQWVSYSRLGPLAYPMAMAAAIKYNFEQDPKAMTRTRVESLGKAMVGMAQFFSDQSYVSGMGNLVKALQGDEQAMKQSLTNMPAQLIPLASLQRWITQVVDPIYRKPENWAQTLAAGIPLLSKGVPAYTNPAGLPSQRQNPVFNAFSPMGVTSGNPGYENLYQLNQSSKVTGQYKTQLNQAVKNRDVPAVRRLLQNNVSQLKQNEVNTTVTSKMATLNKLRDLITADRNISDQERQRRLMVVQTEMQNLAGVGNQIRGAVK